jgi:cytochrome c-type biogenesis protein CcmH/NrfF
MRLLWWIPIAVVVAGAGLLMRARKRRHEGIDVTSEPVSSEWLAQARGRDEHRW